MNPLPALRGGGRGRGLRNVLAEQLDLGAGALIDQKRRRALEVVAQGGSRRLGEAGLKPKRPFYAGREASASPATGLAKRHAAEQAALIAAALGHDARAKRKAS